MDDDSDDMPPALEDCSVFLQHQREILLNANTTPDTHTAIAVTNGNNCNTRQTSAKPVKKTNTSGFSNGFLLPNKRKKKKKKKKNKKQNPTKIAESHATKNNLIIDEAQQKRKATTNGQLNEMANKLHANPVLWNNMLSKDFEEGLQLMATDPKSALQKYKNDPMMLQTFQKVIETMTNQPLSNIAMNVQTSLNQKKRDDKRNDILRI